MFDFEKLDLYGVVRKQNATLFQLLSDKKIEIKIMDRWKEASLSCLLNLVEGTSRISPEDKKQYLTVARGSVFTCTALLQLCLDLEYVSQEEYDMLYAEYERISKMMLGMYRSYSSN